ncbi:MAG: SH3 domain-containing protein, partial [Fibrobacter sp.]|nr:SH3 domain-containing protein [Fibrobacter sp.]
MLLLKLKCKFLYRLFLVFTLFVAGLQAQQQIEINDFFAKVYLAPNTNSKFIGLAQKGEIYQVLESRESWYRIRFKNAVGWI